MKTDAVALEKEVHDLFCEIESMRKHGYNVHPSVIQRLELVELYLHKANTGSLPNAPEYKRELEDIRLELGSSVKKWLGAGVYVKEDKHLPPQTAEYILRLLVDPTQRETLMGDCEQDYRKDIERRGLAFAKACYYGQAAKLVWPWLARNGRRLGFFAALGDLVHRWHL